VSFECVEKYQKTRINYKIPQRDRQAGGKKDRQEGKTGRREKRQAEREDWQAGGRLAGRRETGRLNMRQAGRLAGREKDEEICAICSSELSQRCY